ncbi:MAG TPA: hypothetical protein IAC41_07215, partial [Candidatus Merdenecus merdavium]|nr:hypothetical protein [Candidatus Merdenecus merdavium]
EKLNLILSLAEQSGNKQQKEMIPFLLAAASKTKSQGINFSSDEVDLIIDAMKVGKSKEEVQRMEQISNMMKLMGPKR